MISSLWSRIWVKVVAIIFCIWLVVSAYFHFQHITVVQTASIEDEIVLEQAGVTLLLREVSIYNYNQQLIRRIEPNDFLMKIMSFLPNRMQIPFLNLCYFYDSPYTFYDNEREFHVCGLLQYEGSNEDMPDFAIYEPDGRRIDDSYSLQTSSNKNYKLFSIEGKIFTPEISKVILKVYDKKRGRQDREVLLEQSYNLEWDRSVKMDYCDRVFQGKGYREFDSVSPDSLVSRYLGAVVRKEWTKIEGFIHPDHRHHYEIGAFGYLQYCDEPGYNTKYYYLGDYKGFDNVVRVDIDYLDKNDRKIASQEIYFTYEDYCWSIVDVTPVTSS